MAILGAEAASGLGDPDAIRFAEAVKGTPAELIVRAYAADRTASPAARAALWRAGLTADMPYPVGVRICLINLAQLGALRVDDFDVFGKHAGFDDSDKAILRAHNRAFHGDVDGAVGSLSDLQMVSPAACEATIEILRRYGRLEDALDICDHTIQLFPGYKAMIEKMNTQVGMGRYEEADRSARDLLARPDFPTNGRHELRVRLIESSWRREDWATVERDAASALDEYGEDYRFAWLLIMAQLLQDRADNAWRTYIQVNPPLLRPEDVPVWLDLHLRTGREELLSTDARRKVGRVAPEIEDALRAAVDLTNTP